MCYIQSVAGEARGSCEEPSKVPSQCSVCCGFDMVTPRLGHLLWSFVLVSLVKHCPTRTCDLGGSLQVSLGSGLHPVLSPHLLGVSLLFLFFFRDFCLSLCFILIWMSPISDSWRSCFPVMVPQGPRLPMHTGDFGVQRWIFRFI